MIPGMTLSRWGSPLLATVPTDRSARISKEAVDLSRMENELLLDSHQSGGINNTLGRSFHQTWITRDAMVGRCTVFNATPNGELAMGMVERNEIARKTHGSA